MQSRFKLSHLSLAIVAASLSPCTLFAAEAVDAEVDALSAAAEPIDAIKLKDAVVTAKQELKQAPGVSIITAEDIKKRPPVNDLSEIGFEFPVVAKRLYPQGALAAHVLGIVPPAHSGGYRMDKGDNGWVRRTIPFGGMGIEGAESGAPGAVLETRYFFFLDYGGVKSPRTVDLYRDNVQTARVVYDSVIFNAAVDGRVFDKPATSKDLK